MIAFFTSCSMCVRQTAERRVLCVLHRCDFFLSSSFSSASQFCRNDNVGDNSTSRAHTQHLCRLTNIIIYYRASCGDGKKIEIITDCDCLYQSVHLRARACVCVRCRTRHLNGGGAAAVHRWLKLTSWKDQRWIFKEIFECYRIGPSAL